MKDDEEIIVQAVYTQENLSNLKVDCEELTVNDKEKGREIEFDLDIETK